MSVDSSVNHGSSWPGKWSRQLLAEEASRFTFSSLLELVPNDEKPFLLPVHPDIDQRSPMTYKQLHELSNSLQNNPVFSGLNSKSRVAASLSNRPELASLFLSVTNFATFAPLNPNLSKDEVNFELRDIPADCLIVAAGHSNRPAALVAIQLGIRVIELHPDPFICGMFSLTSVEFEYNNNLLIPTRNTIALIMHTSGTTRRPKVVCIGAICVASTLQLSREDVSINVM
eukprot:GSMAST32.ASY1.ANO1.1456.1 assembled CDS